MDRVPELGVSLAASCTGEREHGGSQHCFHLWVLTHRILSHFQEPDYGALYEGRNPGFYVEANPMPTFKVWPRASAQEAGEGPQLLGACISLLRPICGLCGEVVFVVFRDPRGCERCVVGLRPQRSQGRPLAQPLSLGVSIDPSDCSPG